MVKLVGNLLNGDTAERQIIFMETNIWKKTVSLIINRNHGNPSSKEAQ